MKTIIISKNDSGQRADKFMQKSFPLIPHSLLYRYFRLKRIKVNKKRIDPAEKLCEGDVIELYINDELLVPGKKKHSFMSAGKELNIIFEDDNIMIINKPAGLLCHSDSNEFNDTLVDRVKRYLYTTKQYDPENDKSFAPALANRIDRNTCGIVIAAKNSEALRILNEKIKSREIKKSYYCLIHGKMNNDEGTLTGFISKNEENNVSAVKETDDGNCKKIITKYKTLVKEKNISLLEIELLTGRTHQIRAHLSSVGHPIVGDKKYGAPKNDLSSGYKYQALCSAKIGFFFESDAGILEYLNNKKFEIKPENIWFLH